MCTGLGFNSIQGPGYTNYHTNKPCQKNLCLFHVSCHFLSAYCPARIMSTSMCCTLCIFVGDIIFHLKAHNLIAYSWTCVGFKIGSKSTINGNIKFHMKIKIWEHSKRGYFKDFFLNRTFVSFKLLL